MAAFTRTEHSEFLDAELAAQIQQFQQKLETSAAVLLENGDLFVAQFIKLNEQGQMILKLNTERRSIPRRGDYLRAMVVRGEFQNYKTWGAITYGGIIKKGQINFSETVCIWHSSTDDARYTLVAFNGLDIAFAKVLVGNCIIILGPQEPPIAYLTNLQSLTHSAPPELPAGNLLDLDMVAAGNDWLPTPIANDPHFLLNQIQVADRVLIQGPPGTGKTTLLAEMISILLSQGKSVLVTALTNRALIELANKEALKSTLKEGRIYKAALKWEEKIELPQLQEIREIYSSPYNLTLATFFISSAWALTSTDIKPFDVVIVDEASQSLLAMLAASCQLAPKVIWVGDPMQLPPVVILSGDEITKRKAWPLIEGMTTVADHLAYPSFQLTHTFRLTPRAACLTGIFYRDTLRAAEKVLPRLFFPEMPMPHRDWLHKEGGPILQTISLPPGDPAPQELLIATIMWIKALKSIREPDMKIVVLAKLRKTVRAIQWALAQIGLHVDVQVDTVERVQGLTCDICLFLLPDSNLGLALQQPLFNVATSRAQRHTIIIASDQIDKINSIPTKVRQYLSTIDKENPHIDISSLYSQ